MNPSRLGHACNPKSGKSHLWLHSEFGVSLGSMRPYFKVKCKQKVKRPDMMHICNPRTWDIKTGGLRVPGSPGLLREILSQSSPTQKAAKLWFPQPSGTEARSVIARIMSKEGNGDFGGAWRNFEAHRTVLQLNSGCICTKVCMYIYKRGILLCIN